MSRTKIKKVGKPKTGGKYALREKKPSNHWGDDVADYMVRESFDHPDQFGIYLRDYNVSVATFAPNSTHIRQALARMMDAAHALKASRDADFRRTFGCERNTAR